MEDQIQSNMSHSQHRVPLIADVLPENDAVILSSSSATDSLSNPQFTEYQNETTFSHWQDTGDVGKSILMGDSNLSTEQFFRLYEQAGPEKTRRNEKYNMRKSLAWDAAFFTCEGVLDPDELSGMIERDNKFGKHLLPDITEDICRSTDSISSLGSDSLAMESIEADLMRDIRASIQKSCNVGDTTGFRKTSSALGKADTAPKDLAKIKSGTKKQNSSVPLGRLTKKSPDCSQGAQIAPKVMGRRNPTTSVSMERVTSSGNQVKTGQGGRRANSSTVPGKIAPTTKTGLCGSRGTALKPPLCMKSSSINSSVTSKKDPQKHCVSSHSSSGASSTNVGLSTRKTALKPPLCMKSSSFSSSVTSKKDQQKRSVSSDSSSAASTTNVGKSLSKQKITPRIVTPSSSSSMTKLPAKVALKAKRPTSLSASSASSVRSNISPASSISDWSSVTSSLASTVIRRPASRTTDIRLPHKTQDKNVPLAAGRPKHSNDQFLNRNEKKASLPSDGKVKAASSQVGVLSGSATTKPSGLRIPSPNMGYFDGAKSVVHTPKRSPRSISVIPASPRNGRGIHNISGSLSKTNAPSTSKMNASSRKPASPKPASSSASSISRRTRSRLNVSPQVKSVESVENCLKEEEIGPISAKPDPKGTDEIGITAILERERNLQKQSDINLENAKIDFIEGDACSIRPICNHVEEVKPVRAKTDVEGAETESTGVLESKMKSPELVGAKNDCIEADACPLGSICNPEHVKEVGPVGDKPDTDAAEGTTDIGVVESELIQKGGDVNRKDTHIDCMKGDTHSFVSISNAEHVKEICVVSERDTDGDDETGNTDAAEGVKDVCVGESELGSQKEGDVKRKDSSIDCISGDTCSFGSSSNAEQVKEIGCVRAKPDTDGAEESGNSGLLESEMNSHTQGVSTSEVGPLSKPNTDDAEGTVHVGVRESEPSLQKQGEINRKDAYVEFVAGDICSLGSISNAVHVKEIGCVRAKLDTDDAEETGNTDLLESELNSHLKEVGSIGVNPGPMEAEEAGNKGVPDHETKLQIVINLEDAEHLRLSAEMDKLQELQYPKNILNNVGENEKENMYDGGQVDILSIPAERKESKQGSGAELVQKYVSQTDFGHQGSDLNEGSQGNLSRASPFSHFSATKETGMDSRTPLTDMNSLCNNEEGFDPPATMNSKAVKKTVTFPLLERTVAENT